MNYVLEGGIDFNAELMMALCDEATIDDDSICLIDGQSLDSNHVKLACGHKFNYSSLLLEVQKQKRHNPSNTHLETQRLSKYDLKCPYCRTIQHGVMGYVDGYDRIKGVNWPPSKAFKPYKCSAIFKSGKHKGRKCMAPSLTEYCKKHTAVGMRCGAVLVSGKRKGCECGCKARLVEGSSPPVHRCGKHSKKKGNKSNIVLSTNG